MGAADNGKYTSRLLVDKWLSDRGQAFRCKPEMDKYGRTVYVLATCPFNNDHGDPDSCIMQGTDGKMSAQCFHNSCGGNGWQEFKEAIGKPDAGHYDPPLKTKKRATKRASATGVAPDEESEHHGIDRDVERKPRLPTIRANRRQLRDVTDCAVAALLKANDPPILFHRGGILTRLVNCDNGLKLDPLTDHALRGHLARAADWVVTKTANQGDVDEEDAPPMEVVKDLANLPEWSGIPRLSAIIECPVFSASGQLIATPGYHAESGMWYAPSADLLLDPDALRAPVDADEVASAKNLLLDDLLGDFPFVDDASRAHALAAILLPFVRQMIPGPTPLHLVDAPTEGSGKTLLLAAVTHIHTGRSLQPMTEGGAGEEWRKRLTAALAEGPSYIMLDNLAKVVDSAALASILTADTWKGIGFFRRDQDGHAACQMLVVGVW